VKTSSIKAWQGKGRIYYGQLAFISGIKTLSLSKKPSVIHHINKVKKKPCCHFNTLRKSMLKISIFYDRKNSANEILEKMPQSGSKFSFSGIYFW
jgi:hypothetical protein